MTKLAKHYDDSKLTAVAGHLDNMIDRMKIINHTPWSEQFGQVAEALLAHKPRYHVENILLDEDQGLLHVDYCQEHDYKDFENGLQPIDEIIWFEESISLTKLQAFALEEQMNHYCKDWADHAGEYQQETGVIPIEHLMDQYDFLQEVAKDYLEAGREVEL